MKFEELCGIIVRRLRGLYGPNPSMTDASEARGGALLLTTQHSYPFFFYTHSRRMYKSHLYIYNTFYAVFCVQVSPRNDENRPSRRDMSTKTLSIAE